MAPHRTTHHPRTPAPRPQLRLKAKRGLGRWKEILGDEGYDPADVHLGEYVSLSNEITIKDIAEGFDRALRELDELKHGQEFDAIVHSTGGLVIREWLATYPSRRTRVKHMVGLAPAMFGSPLAHKGRSWLGAIFKGEKGLFSPDRAPDFLEAGTRVLSGLEMGSSYTWQLAERDPGSSRTGKRHRAPLAQPSRRRAWLHVVRPRRARLTAD